MFPNFNELVTLGRDAKSDLNVLIGELKQTRQVMSDVRNSLDRLCVILEKKV